MIDIKSNNTFYVPEDHKIIDIAGAYVFTEKDGQGYLCGGEVRNFKEQFEVSKICLSWHKKEHLLESGLINIFILEDDVWYYGVSYSKFSFLFYRIEDALKFIAILSNINKSSLENE